MRTARPRISVGLPVYNGANYVAAAIESVLAQTWADFELIISDNASTDATADICRGYADRDRRIRFDRLDTNIGASANFNRVFAMARGEFFRWHAHDDLMAPSCLQRCLGELEDDVGAVLCRTQVRRIGPDGEDFGVYDSGLRLRSRRPSKRLAGALLVWHDCTDMFSLIRSRALTGTSLIAAYAGSDRALIAELALRGRFLTIDEPLFLNRDHPRRYIRATWHNPHEAAAWYRSTVGGKAVLHNAALFRDHWRAIDEVVDQPLERLRCKLLVARAALEVPQNRNGLIKDLLQAIDPRLLGLITATRSKWAGA